MSHTRLTPEAQAVTLTASSNSTVEDSNSVVYGNILVLNFRARISTSLAIGSWHHLANASVAPASAMYLPVMIYDRGASDPYLSGEIRYSANGKIDLFTGVALVSNDIIYVSGTVAI